MKTVVIKMRVNENTHERIKEIAEKEHRSIMDQYRHVIEQWVNKTGGDSQ